MPFPLNCGPLVQSDAVGAESAADRIQNVAQERSYPALKVLLLSQRHVADLPAYCLSYEFEDTFAAISDARRIDVAETATVELSRRIYKAVRLASGSSKLAHQIAPHPKGRVFLNEEFDLFFPVFNHAYELYSLSVIPNWRRRCRKAACYVAEMWPDMLPEYLIELLGELDHVFVGNQHAVNEISRLICRPCTHLPLAVDVLRFAPSAVDLPRPIEVCNIGRRSQVTHQSLLEDSDRRGTFYLYDTVAASGVGSSDRSFHVENTIEHRRMLATLLKHSRFYIANRGYANRPGPDVESARFYEGAAAGTVMIGEAPRSEEFARQFDWTDAVIPAPFDSPHIARLLAELDRDPERLLAVRRNNMYHAALRHDWLHRVQVVLETLGLPSTGKMQARSSRLDDVASRARSSGSA